MMDPHGRLTDRMPPARNRLEALYSDLVQQLEHLHFPNLRRSAKQFIQSTEVKGWMRFSRRKSTETKQSTSHREAQAEERSKQLNTPPTLSNHHHHSLPQRRVNSECQAYSKHWNQSLGSKSERRKRQERPSEVAGKTSRIRKAKSASTSNRKVETLRYEPGISPPRICQSSSEIGRFRKSIETMNTSRSCTRERTAAGCESLAITRRSSKGKSLSTVQPLTSIETECSGTFFHIRNLHCSHEGTAPHPVNKLETRPASKALRRQFNCNSLMEGVKSRRALDANRKRECRNAPDEDAPVAIALLKSNRNQAPDTSRITNKRSTTLRNEDTNQKFRNSIANCKEVDCKGATRASDQIGSERGSSWATLDSSLSEKCRPLATATRTTAILQDALAALECAHRWNEWGARTLHELARASKAAAERNQLLLDWPCIQKPDILLPHDNDVRVSTQRGRVLENREEEREFIHALLVAAGITNGGWVDQHHLLNARQRVVSPIQKTTYRKTTEVGRLSFERRLAAAERRNRKKRVAKSILYDFVEEMLRNEIEFQKWALMELNLDLSISEQERKGQALVQRVWNNLQLCPFPASDDIHITVQNLLQRDIQSQGSTRVEMAEVIEELEEMIYRNLMQELLRELTTVKSK